MKSTYIPWKYYAFYNVAYRMVTEEDAETVETKGVENDVAIHVVPCLRSYIVKMFREIGIEQKCIVGLCVLQ